MNHSAQLPVPEGAKLVLSGLEVTFETPGGPLRVVDDVGFRVDAGRTLALVGESGSGKSVTGLALARLLPGVSRPRVAGSAHFRRRDGSTIDLLAAGGRDLAGLRGAEIAMVFQDPTASLNPVFTVGRQLAETLVRHEGLSGAALPARVIELLDHVGIADARARARAWPHQLSGGMRQRVMIAMAIACRPGLLVADEPTTALDVTIEAQIIDLLARLQSEFSMAVIFVSHNLALVSEIADRVVVLYAGQVVEEGPAAQVIGAPRHPYTRALIDCLPRSGVRASDLEPIPGSVPSPDRRPHGCRFAPRCRFARPDCVTEPPELVATGGDHRSRCRYWTDLVR